MEYTVRPEARPEKNFRAWFMDKLFMGMSVQDYSRSLVTPFNIIAALILLASVPVFAVRYLYGLETVVHATNEYPWGLLLSWGIFASEPLFAAGFVVAAGYYIFGFKSYKPLVRLAVVGGMLGYAFAASYLIIDLGRPWRIYYPTIINFGPASILFIVAWHVVLYLTVQFFEFSPAILEWLGSRRLHRWAVSVTVALMASSSPRCTSQPWAPCTSSHRARSIPCGTPCTFRSSSSLRQSTRPCPLPSSWRPGP
jgi:Ni/Fe-hydrogenase subunit HybB-like protein